MLQALAFAALLLGCGAAWAGQVVGVVTQLSGPLLDRKADGSAKVLGLKSEVENGDTLVSEKNTYALIRFIDNSEITLRPGTTFRIDKFSYDAGKPEEDSAAFDLVKGGLRSITGLLGKRNKEKFSLKTPTATIGIRGTTFIAHYVPPPPGLVPGPDMAAQGKLPPGSPPGVTLGDAVAPVPGRAPAAPVLAPGLHLQVTDGAIIVTNNGGALGFQAGQFGYVPNMNVPPVIVPSNPGLQFVPPPTFGGNAPGSGPVASAGGLQEQGGVDCIVR